MKFPIEFEIVSKILPQKYPFQFVDKVLTFIKNESITTCKTFKIDEFYFQGHFPSRPVVPGVLLIENMAQSAGLLFALNENGIINEYINASGQVSLGIVKKVHFKKAVFPGNCIETRIDVIRIISTGVIVSALIRVNQEFCAKGKLSLSLLEPK